MFVPLGTYYRVPSPGNPIELEIRQIVREDAITLYGFATRAEKVAFDLLTGIQHVGPKLALAVLSVLTPEELASAIEDEDVARIDAVPGVGAKVAERVVRELRDKTSALTRISSSNQSATSDRPSGAAASIIDDAISALVNLGYKPIEAKQAVDTVRASEHTSSLETLLRRALAVILGER